MAKIMTIEESQSFLSSYLPIAKSQLTKTLEQAKLFTKKYPIVLKIVSPQAIHKTDIKGIKIANTPEEVTSHYNELTKIAKTKKLKLKGILVQEYIEGKNLIIGIKKDPSFGHVIMFGLGGIFVEILKDVSFRVCPITKQDAESMINELKAKQILLGARGEKPINLKLLIQTLIQASQIPIKNPKITELDINPFIINEKLGKIVDSRISMD